MIEPKIAAVMTAILLLPGIAYLYVNDLLDEPLAWLGAIGLGGGAVVAWAGGQLQGDNQKVVMALGGALMFAGLVATSIMGL